MSAQADLKGQTAIVTGASSGIGRAIAERLGRAGAHVVLVGRTRDPMEASAELIAQGGGRATIAVVDVCDADAFSSLVAATAEAEGRLDIFVNNAGVAFLGTVLEGSVDAWRSMLETNVVALLVGSQAAVAAMRAHGSAGHIINISSVAAQSGESGVYGATKHAVNVITRTLRQELFDDPIQVTSIMPGLVATNIGRNVDPELLAGIVALSGVDVEVRPGERLPDEVLDSVQSILTDIMISPDDVAEAVHFAVSRPASVHVTDLAIRPNKDFDLGG